MLISQSILSFSLPKMTTTHQSFPNFFKASTTLQSPKEVKELKNKLSCASSLSREKVEIFKSMDEWASEGILPLLKPVEKSWQPDELLPDSNSEEFIEQINELRERSKEIPDDCLVALVGNIITEEALPSYQTRINCTEVYRDETGIDNSPWAVWTRGWTAEENRHGDLLNKYLYLSGRIDMKQVEKTIQYLVASGIDIGTGGNPYHLTIYTSFQERATFISHGNTARLALKHGDTKLAQICGTIAADEKRHETAYSRIVGKLFELDPSGAVEAFADMMKKKVGMPGQLMHDGQDLNLFDHYSNVAMRLGVYTTTDYINILEHLVNFWNVEKLSGLTNEAKMAQDFVCRLPERLRKLEERAQERAKQAPAAGFSWVFNREVC